MLIESIIFFSGSCDVSVIFFFFFRRQQKTWTFNFLYNITECFFFQGTLMSFFFRYIMFMNVVFTIACSD